MQNGVNPILRALYIRTGTTKSGTAGTEHCQPKQLGLLAFCVPTSLNSTCKRPRALRDLLRTVFFVRAPNAQTSRCFYFRAAFTSMKVQGHKEGAEDLAVCAFGKRFRMS